MRAEPRHIGARPTLELMKTKGDRHEGRRSSVLFRGSLALLINLPMELLVLTVLASMGGIAMAGMSTSATIAGMMTLIEVVVLITIVFIGA